MFHNWFIGSNKGVLVPPFLFFFICINKKPIKVKKMSKRNVYDNGFKKYYYICQNCGSEEVLQIPSGGFSPPVLKCNECEDKVTNNPITVFEEVVEDERQMLIKLYETQLEDAGCFMKSVLIEALRKLKETNLPIKKIENWVVKLEKDWRNI